MSILYHAIAIVVRVAVGLLIGKSIPAQVTQTVLSGLVLSGLGLCVRWVGITRLKVANFLLAPFVPLLFHVFR